MSKDFHEVPGIETGQSIILMRDGVNVSIGIDDDTLCPIVAMAVVDAMRALSYSDKCIIESFEQAFGDLGL